MKYPYKGASKKAGLSAGSFVFTGEKKTDKVTIDLIDYDEKNFNMKEIKNIEECLPFKEKPTVTWININGLHKIKLIEEIGELFNIHPLLIEDILNVNKRPKVEDFENYLFIVLKMMYLDDQTKMIEMEQVSLILGENYVITLQEQKGDVFDQIRERIKNGKGRIRKLGADYLCYALIDSIVDNYFVILERIGEIIEDIEEELMEQPSTETLYSIHTLKREMIHIRRSIWPLREVISTLLRGESVLINPSSDIFLRDVYEHTIQVVDTIETYRDMLSGMLDLYLSSISNKTNEVMKVLTIIATIFIPLTFVAGIYGMNFDPDISPFNMPELEWYYGYPVALFVMFIISILMIIYFRRKDWL